MALSSNFRAGAPLVDWANHAFSKIMGDREDPVLGQIAYRQATATQPAEREHAVQLVQSGSADSQIAEIVDRIESLLSRSEGSIALLVRSRGQLTELIRTLRARGISWRANDIDPLLDRPAVSDLLALVSALADPFDRQSWMSLLRAPFVGLKLEDLSRLVDIEDFPAFLDAVRQGEVTIALSRDAQSRVDRLVACWPESRTMTDELPQRSLVETIWLKLGGADAYADPAALNHAARLLSLLDSMGPGPVTPEALRQAGQRLFAEDLSDSRLEILTVHKAKGLEFDHVLVPFLERTTRSDESELLLWRSLPEGLLMGVQEDDGPFEWLKRENRYRERHERQRLFYVACTRAKRTLTLFTSEPTGDKPADSTMLSLLWPQLEAGDTGNLIIRSAIEQSVPAQSDLFDPTEAEATTAPPFQRLVSDYQWQMTEDPTLPQLTAATEADRQDPLEARMEVVLGIVVHAALEKLATETAPEDIERYLNTAQPAWRAMAAEHELNEEDVERVVSATTGQIRGVLQHVDGQWLLKPGPDAYSELAVTAAIDGSVQNFVIDRTFTDPETGERWVVDFKTAIPPEDMSKEAFIRVESNRYRPQLARYGTIAAALFDQPIRLALYFTALPELVELTGQELIS